MLLLNNKTKAKIRKGCDMKQVCMICKKVYGYKEGGNSNDITHGICPECLPKYKADLEKEVEAILMKQGKTDSSLCFFTAKPA